MIIAIANQKGGVGKSTTAVNLAACFGEKKQRTLLIDMDPQASASAWLGIRDAGRAILEVLTEGRPLVELVQETTVPGVDLLPSSSWLFSAEKALAAEVGAENLLRKAVEKLPKGRWDYILIDCPPSLGLLSICALVAADQVLIPVEARAMALAGLADLTQTLERVRDRLNAGVELAAILACRVDNRTNLAKDVVAQLRRSFGTKVLKAVVRENIRLAEAPTLGKPITTYATSSSGAEDYRAVATEFLRVLRRKGKVN